MCYERHRKCWKSVKAVEKEKEKEEEVSRQPGGATVIFGRTVGILAEQKDRYKLWGGNFNAQSGGLEKLLDGAGRMRETVLPILCRIAEDTVVIARQSNLAEALEAVFQQIEEIKKQVGDMGTGKPALFEDDDFSSSESEGSRKADVSAVAEALKDIEFSNDLLYKLGPALYENAERMASRRRDSSTDVK